MRLVPPKSIEPLPHAAMRQLVVEYVQLLSWHGSLLSGSEVGFKALAQLVACLAEKCLPQTGSAERRIPLKHCFACEGVGWKREWILDHCQVDHVFGQASSLLEGYGHRYREDKLVETDSATDADWLWFGFSCACLNSRAFILGCDCRNS